MAVAVLIILQGKERIGASAINWLTELKTSEAINLCLMLIAIGLLTVAVVLIRRTVKQQATLLAKMEAIRIALDLEEDIENIAIKREDLTIPDDGLPVGAMAPAFTLTGVDDIHRNQDITLDGLLAAGKPIMLFFASPHCVPCKSLLPAVKGWERQYGDRLTFVVISKGKLQETYVHMTKYDLNHLLEADATVADAYRSQWTPGAILIDSDGKIASEMTYGDEEIRKMFNGIIASDEFQAMEATVSGATARSLPVLKIKSVLQLGDPAPSFALPDLQGRIVHSKDLFTQPTVLLFWHPDCKHCDKIFDYLKLWEQAPPDRSRQLVYISFGDTQETRDLNGTLQSLTLLDPGFNVGPLYGARHTPSAILIEAGGKIASSLAIGDSSVLALLGPAQMEIQTARSA
jgi:thiol-disulfide isomerase/thioredoxin